jgi:hypothetical protein
MAYIHADGTRFFSFTGNSVQASYVVDYVKVPPNSLAPEKFLDGGLQFGILFNDGKNEKFGPGYQMSWLSFLQTDELNHKTQMALTNRQLKVIDPANLVMLKPKRSAFFANNDGLGRTIVDEFSNIAPKFSEFVDHIVNVTINAEPKSTSTRPWLKVTMLASLDVERIKKSYPNFALYLERITRFVDVKSSAEILTDDGLRLISIGYNSASHGISMSFATSGGAFLPQSGNGEPVFDRGIVPIEMSAFDGALTSDMDINVLGLKMRSSGTKFKLSFRDGMVARLDWKLRDMSVPTFSGAFFGFMPPGLLDFLMPGNLNEYAKILTVGLVKGNGGRGTFGGLEVNSTVEQSTIIRGIASTEIKDNFFLNIGLRIISDYLWPTPEAFDDFRRLVADGLERLVDDLKDLRREGPSP